MKRTVHIQTILALFCVGAVSWMLAQPQSVKPGYAQAPPIPTPIGLPPLPDGSHLCVGNATITGTVLDTNGNPVAGAMIQLDEVQLPNLDREATSCSGYLTDENGDFTVTELRATEWMLSVQPPSDDETLLATQSVHLVIEEDAAIEINEPFILTGVQVMAVTTLQDGTTPAFSLYHLYGTYDFNGDGEAACYLSTTNPSYPFYRAFSMLSGSTAPNYIALREYTDGDGLIQLGSLPEGDYCLRAQSIDVNADEPSSAFMPLLEREFSIASRAGTVNLGTLVPDPTPKRLTISAVTETGEPAVDVIFSAYKATPPAGGASGRTDETGTLSFNVVGGTWYIQQQENVGILWSENDLQANLPEATFAQDGTVESQTITIIVDMENSSPATGTIRGTVRKPDGSPAIGAKGTVSLSAGAAGADDWQWQSAEIDPETATFEAIVLPATWRLSYSLHVYSADDEYAAYKPFGETTVVTVEEDETAVHDMTLIGFDSTVRGTVLAPDGTAISAGRVWVRDGGFMRRPVEVVDGVFETQLLSGIEYMIEVDDEFGALAANGWGVPALYKITTSPNDTTEIELQLRALDATIFGTVYREEVVSQGSDFIDIQLVPVQNAEVYATTPDGQCIHAITGEDGRYALAVPSGTTWDVAAYWGMPGPEREFYATRDKLGVIVADPQAYEIDLTVAAVSFELPPDLDETFDAAEAWSGTLGDGTIIELPANAVPVEDQDGDDVHIVVKPMTTSLPRAHDVDVVKYGYDIQLFSVHTGQPINSALNGNMTITYPYDDEMLDSMNSDESSLGVSVRSEDSQTWKPASSVSLDEAANTLRISLDRLAVAAITVRSQRDAVDNATDNDASGDESDTQIDVSVFLPLLAK